ncbi:hypothetical protein ABIE52_000314 [Rhodococcus sp. OAS809]
MQRAAPVERRARLNGRAVQPGTEQFLAFLAALSTFRLCSPEEVRKFVIAVTFRVSNVGLHS